MPQSDRQKAIHATKRQLKSKQAKVIKINIERDRLDREMEKITPDIQFLKEKLRRQHE